MPRVLAPCFRLRRTGAGVSGPTSAHGNGTGTAKRSCCCHAYNSISWSAPCAATAVSVRVPSPASH